MVRLLFAGLSCGSETNDSHQVSHWGLVRVACQSRKRDSLLNLLPSLNGNAQSHGHPRGTPE
jgi:hypothetical protein